VCHLLNHPSLLQRHQCSEPSPPPLRNTPQS
jgi:hypothetical protein